MRFGFDDDQRLLQTTLNAFLRNECTPERIRDVVRQALGDSDLRANAQSMSKEIEAMPGMDEAVALVVETAGSLK